MRPLEKTPSKLYDPAWEHPVLPPDAKVCEHEVPCIGAVADVTDTRQPGSGHGVLQFSRSLSVFLSVCLSACLPARPPGWLAGCQSVCQSVCLFVCLFFPSPPDTDKGFAGFDYCFLVFKWIYRFYQGFLSSGLGSGNSPCVRYGPRGLHRKTRHQQRFHSRH